MISSHARKRWIRALLVGLADGRMKAKKLMSLDDDLVYSAWMEAATAPRDEPGDRELAGLLVDLERTPEAGFLFGLARLYLEQVPTARTSFEAELKRRAPAEARPFLEWAALGRGT